MRKRTLHELIDNARDARVMRLNGFAHPCRGTCSGYRSGYDDAARGIGDPLTLALRKAVDAMEYAWKAKKLDELGRDLQDIRAILQKTAGK